jgi:hypothetical protein
MKYSVIAGKSILRQSVLLAMLATLFFAATGHAVILNIGSGEGLEGDVVEIPIFLEYDGDPAPAALSFSFQYSTQFLQVVDVVAGTSATNAAKTVAWTSAGEMLRILVGGVNANTMDEDIVVWVQLEVIVPSKAIFSADLTGSDGAGAAADATPLAVQFTDGDLVADIDVVPAVGMIALTCLVLFLLGFGVFYGRGRQRFLALLLLLVIVTTSALALVVAGDVNLSGAADMSDLALVVDKVLGEDVLEGTDLDFSGTTDAVDYQLLVLIILGNDLDSDDDGLLDVGEENLGTLVDNDDSDNDGLTDGDEVLIHDIDPNDDDSDNDGLTDGDEVNVHNTDPVGWDTDGDNLSDGDEVDVYETDPTDDDSDDDGVDDGTEVDLGEDPNVATFYLRINEIVTSNQTGLLDEDGESSDWIELYNPGDSAISLSGWTLTDDSTEPTKWSFPDISIGADSYLVIFASGMDRTPVNGDELHTNFKLDLDGENLSLHNDAGIAVSSRAFDPYPRQISDHSYGVAPEGAELWYFDVPTPGAANTGSKYIDIVAPPEFSVERGFYDTTFELSLLTDTPGATVRYTLDGSVPTATNGIDYSGPITVNSNAAIQAVAFEADYLPSMPIAHTYIFGATAAQKSVPSMCIVADEGESLYAPNGIMAIVGGHYEADDWDTWNCCNYWVPDSPSDYNNPMQHGREYERPISLEYINPDDNSGFQINAGFRVQGSSWHRPRYRTGDNWTGCSNFNKFSFKFYFRDSYGDKWLDYPLFERSEIDRFRIVTLRGGMNDSCNPFIKDEMIRRLHQDMGAVAVVGNIAHLYINGEYKAFYNPCERLDETSFQEMFNSSLEWDVFTQNAWWGIDTARSGDMVAINDLINYARNNDLSQGEHYDEVARRLDLKEFIDYVIVECYSGNWDWPGNNWTMARERSDTGQFRFYVWDAEASMESGRLNDSRISAVKGDWGPIGTFYNELSDNPDFRQLFVDRLQKHFFNAGALTEANINTSFTELQSMMAGIQSIDTYIENTWIPNRGSFLLGEFLNDGMFTFEGPRFSINATPQQGGYADAGDELTMVNPQGSGTMYYTLDGSDPRLPDTGGGIVSTTTLIAEDAPKRALVPTVDIGTDWQGGVAFDDSGWAAGTSGVGYDTGANYVPYFDIDVETEMHNTATTCYIRIPFSVDAVERGTYNSMDLRVRYDDGFVAYINGEEVTRSSGARDPLNFDSASAEGHDDTLAVNFVTFNISNHLDKLVDGSDNILAIHGLNVSTGSSDFLISAELEAGERTLGAGISPSAIEYVGGVTLSETVMVNARVLDGGQWSGLNQAIYSVGPIAENLRITEIMYHPRDLPDGNPLAEFIEVRNIGVDAINVNLVELTKGIDFTFPNMVLDPGAYAVVVKDVAAFESVYGGGINVAGEYGDSSLNNRGERIKLRDAVETTILDFDYKDGWYDHTDGMGFTLNILDDANVDTTTWGQKEAWRPSSYVLGTPGTADSNAVPPPRSIVINEVLAHSHAAAPDWIELHNTTGAAVDLEGWFLSDNDSDLRKYEIPAGNSIPANGYIVFYEDTHFGVSFALSENGETVYLSSGEAGELTGYSNQEDFGASNTDVAFGRYYKASTDTFNFVAMSANTPGAANAAPLVGPIVISEIMYHPEDEPAGHPDAEFIELHNISASSVELQDDATGATWRITDGVEFSFPPGITMSAGSRVLLVKSSAVFSAEYPGVPGGVPVFQWTSGSLNNAGERVQLSMPGDVDDLAVRQYIRVDRVNYEDTAPWPVTADGAGDSLTRVVVGDYGNDVANWTSASPTPGTN